MTLKKSCRILWSFLKTCCQLPLNEKPPVETVVKNWHTAKIVIIITNGSPNFGQTTRSYNNQPKKENLQKCGLCCPGGPQSEIKKYVKRGISTSTMKVTIIPIVIRALGTVIKGLVQGLDDLEITGWVETIKTIAFLRSARILRRVLVTWGNLSLTPQWETIS